MGRKPGDDIESADDLTYAYCWVCDGSPLHCEHQGQDYYVGNFGGASDNYKYAQFYVEDSVGPKPVHWGDNGDYIMVPKETFDRLVGAHTHTVEFLCEDPPHEDKRTAFYGDWWAVFGNSEQAWGDNFPWVKVPRHAMARYQMQKWGDGVKWRKKIQTLDDRPCFCASPICYDIERSERWLKDYGTEQDYEHDHRMRVLWQVHPMWNPTSRVETIKYQLATYIHIYEEAA